MFVIRATMNDESVDDDSKAEEKEEDVANHGRRLQMQQNPIYKSQPKRRIRGRSRSINIFGHHKTYKEHDSLNHNLGGIKLKISGIRGKSDLGAYSTNRPPPHLK